jgi:hypothetical protein
MKLGKKWNIKYENYCSDVKIYHNIKVIDIFIL